MLGGGVSLLVHAAVIAWLWHDAPPRPASPDTQQARRIAVWLLPAPAHVPPPVRVPTATVAPSSPALSRAVPDSGSTARQRRRITAPALVSAPETPAQAAAPSVSETGNAPAAVAGGDVRAFDLAAARSSARAMARDERKGMATLPLRQEALGVRSTERMQERLERAHRDNCLKGTDSVNLLANVLSLAHDIVVNTGADSGCKW